MIRRRAAWQEATGHGRKKAQSRAVGPIGARSPSARWKRTKRACQKAKIKNGPAPTGTTVREECKIENLQVSKPH